MKLKQFIFALVAMLSFGLSTYAQDAVVVNSFAELKAVLEKGNGNAGGAMRIANSGDLAGAYGPVKLSADIVLEGVITVTRSYLELDLNGFTISGNDTKYIKNLTSTTISDGSINKTGVIACPIYNGDNENKVDIYLKIQGGTFKNLSTSGAAITNYGECEIYAGNFFSEDIALINHNSMEIDGGTGKNVYIEGKNHTVENSGTFVVDYVAVAGTEEGFKAEVGNNETVGENIDYYRVAVNGQYYGKLQDAINAAGDGDLVRLFGNITESNIVIINKAITLDGNGKKLTTAAGIKVAATGTVNIKDFTVEGAAEYALYAESPVEITNSTISGAGAVYAKVNGGRVGLLDTNLTGTTKDVIRVASNVTLATEGGSITATAANDNFIVAGDDECTGALLSIMTDIIELGGATNYVNLDTDKNTVRIKKTHEAALNEKGYATEKSGNALTVKRAVATVISAGNVYKSYTTFAAALDAVRNGETINILNVTGTESGELDYIKDIEFTITGNAPNYALPVVTFQNATVNIENAEIFIPELDARQEAVINVVNSTVHDAGGNSVVKSYYNGKINIDASSTVYAMQVTTMGYINVKGTLNATWQTNVYGNGMITVEDGATFNTAALHLTSQDYSGRDNTDTERVGKPATIIVDGATLTVGRVLSDGDADYSYNSSHGINVGTIDGKNAVLDIKNGATVNIFMADGETANIGANGTVNVADATLNVACRAEGTATLANAGTVYVTGASNLAAAKVTGAGWFYMNGVSLGANTKLLGAKVAFINGTNNVVGSTIENGWFSVGIGQNAAADAAATFAAANGITLGDVTVNVSDNAVVGSAGSTYSGWVGSAYNADKEQHTYTLNINSSLAAFGYMHVSKDGILTVDGRSAAYNRYTYDNANVNFYAGDFIVNGVVTLNNADAWVKFTKMSVDHVDGILNINGDTKFESSIHNGATTSTSLKFWNAGTINVAEAATFDIDNQTVLVDGAVLNIAGKATALGAVTKAGAINFTTLGSTLTSATTGLPVAITNNDLKHYKVVYEGGAYKVADKKYVARVEDDDARFETLAEALDAAQNGQTVELLWAAEPTEFVTNEPIVMAGTVAGNKTVTITGTAQVDWSKGFLFVGRNGEGNGKVIFENANLTSTEASLTNGTYGINVSMAEHGKSTTNDGEVVFKNSNIDLSYLIGKNNVTVDGGKLTVWRGFAVGARPASETNNVQRTSTMNIINGANVVVKELNGMGLGYEDKGVMNIDATSKFETTQSFLVTAKGTMNIAGSASVAGVLTNNGAINFTTLEATLATATTGLTVAHNFGEKYQVVHTDGVYKIGAFVAKIGTSYYATLQEAVNNVQNGETIVLVDDITYENYVYASGKTTAVNIANGKNFTLDLAGKSIIGTNSTEKSYELVTIAKGTALTIEDSSAEKTGKISYTGTRTTADDWMNRCHTIFNRGTLVLNGGTIENNTPTEAEAVASAIDNNASWGMEGYLTVNGGTVISTSYYAVRTDVNTHNTTANSALKAQTTFNGGTVYGFYLMDRGNDYTQWPSNTIEFVVGDAATIKPCAYNGQALRFRVNAKTTYDFTVSENATIEGEVKGIVTIVGNKYYARLQEAVNACVAGDNTITLREDVTEDVTVAQAPNVKITIDGANKTFAGTITVDGKSARYETAALTVNNVNFDATGITYDACVRLGAQGNNNTRYTNNVTIDGCTFTDNDYSAAAVKSYTGGDYNLQIINCTAEGMHSLAQLQNVEEGLVISGNNANTKNGINLNRTYSATISNNTINVKGYAVRAGVDGSTGGEITLTNNTLKTDNTDGDPVIVLRGSVDALNMDENVVSGDTHIKGTAATVAVDANYWDGKDAPVVAEGSPAIRVNSFYADEALTDLRQNHYGNDFIGYTDTYKIWGEVWGNAFDSFVIKVLDANNNVMGTTSLNNINGVIDGDVTVTWSLYFDVDSYTGSSWIMEWTTRPTVDNIPAAVELWVDGAKVGSGPVKLNNPDDAAKKTVAITKDGNIKAFHTSFANAYSAAQSDEVIVLLEDVNATDVVLIDKSVTIDGNGKAIKSSASRVIRVTTGDIKVTLSNLNVVSNAVRVGTNDIRAIAVDANINGVELTLNNCTVDFTDASASDWAYGVNVARGNNHTITINGGTYEGANVVNIWGANNTVNIDGATLNSLYAANDYYYGLCVVLNENKDTHTVNVKNTTFNGKHAVAYEDNITAENNTDNTDRLVAKVGDVYYASVNKAIEEAESGATVQLLAFAIDEYIKAAGDKSITIQGYNLYSQGFFTLLTGGMYIGNDQSKCHENTVVVKNIKFVGKGIIVGDQQNVTIENNVFENITDLVATSSTANENAISVVGKNVNVIVKNNTISNVKVAGINLRNTLTAVVEGNTISNTGHNSITITGQNGATATSVTVSNNTLSDWAYEATEGRAMRISNIATVSVNENVMSHSATAPEEFAKVTGATAFDASKNYWNGNTPLMAGVVTDGSETPDPLTFLSSYYTDAAKTNLVTFTSDKSVAKIGNLNYESLAAAVEGANAGETVTVLRDADGAGVVINKDVTIDFGGYTYTFTSGVGSTGTESNGLQILKDNTVTLKNGTLNVAESAASTMGILIQNYANLTVTDMDLVGENLNKSASGYSYVLSNNCGNVLIDGETNITANTVGANAYAFDAYHKEGDTYYTAPVVTVKTTGTITGNIECSATILIYDGTYTIDVTEWCAPGFAVVKNHDGTYGIEQVEGIEKLTIEVGNLFGPSNASEPYENQNVKKVDFLIYSRDFREVNVWEPLYVPFKLPVSELGENWEVAYFNDLRSYDNNGDALVDSMYVEYIIVRTGTLHANTPYMIRAKNDAAKRMSLMIQGVEVQKTTGEGSQQNVIECSSAYTKFEFVGTYDLLTYAQIVGNTGAKAYIPSVVDGKWYPEFAGWQINPFGVYMRMTQKDGSPFIVDTNLMKSIGAGVVGEEINGTTYIYDVVIENGEEVIYDLQGRRVNSTESGIYIVGGKKVLVK